MTPYLSDPARAFNRAIALGVLSKDPTARNFAGNFMYMFDAEGKHAFKHIGLRQYVYAEAETQGSLH